jgi:hypothetical protein
VKASQVGKSCHDEALVSTRISGDLIIDSVRCCSDRDDDLADGLVINTLGGFCHVSTILPSTPQLLLRNSALHPSALRLEPRQTMVLRGSTSAESDDAKRRSLATTIPHPHTKIPERYPPTLFRVRQLFGSREQWQRLTSKHTACDPKIVTGRPPLLLTAGQDPTSHGLSTVQRQRKSKLRCNQYHALSRLAQMAVPDIGRGKHRLYDLPTARKPNSCRSTSRHLPSPVPPEMLDQAVSWTPTLALACQPDVVPSPVCII